TKEGGIVSRLDGACPCSRRPASAPALTQRAFSMLPSLRKWFPHRQPLPDARTRLLCITYAGGSAAAFRTWNEGLAPNLEVCAVEPPGRSSRFAEPPFRGLEPYVEALVPLVRELADKPLAIFGHSLGAKVTFELARRL